MKTILTYMLALLGTAGLAQNSDIFGGGIGDGWAYGNHTQFTYDIYRGGSRDGWTSGTSDLTILSIIEQDAEAALKIFPNPTEGSISVVLGSVYNLVYVQISNAPGQCVFTRHYADTDRIMLDFDGEMGIYLVTIRYDGRISTFKIIKQ